MSGTELLSWGVGLILGGVAIWNFLIKPVWRVINSILETLKDIKNRITEFGQSIAVFNAIIPRLEKDINAQGIKHEKEVGQLRHELDLARIDIATLKQKLA